MTRGWFKESYRHYLASKGVSTRRYNADTAVGSAVERLFKRGDIARREAFSGTGRYGLESVRTRMQQKESLAPAVDAASLGRAQTMGKFLDKDVVISVDPRTGEYERNPDGSLKYVSKQEYRERLARLAMPSVGSAGAASKASLLPIALGDEWVEKYRSLSDRYEKLYRDYGKDLKDLKEKLEVEEKSPEGKISARGIKREIEALLKAQAEALQLKEDQKRYADDLKAALNDRTLQKRLTPKQEKFIARVYDEAVREGRLVEKSLGANQ